MMPTSEIVLLANRIIAFVAGLMGNAFILCVNLIAWVRGDSNLSCCDLIISSLALSNLGQLGMYFFSFCAVQWIQELMFVIQFFLRSCSLWCSTWFCLYICAKIVTFTQPLLVRVVTRFQEHVSRLLLGSQLVSLAACIPIAPTKEDSLLAHSLANGSKPTDTDVSVNGSLTGVRSHWGFSREKFPYFIIISIIFAKFAVSVVTILITLCRHMKRMGQHADSFRGPSLDAHLGAVKTVTSLLILYSLFYLTQTIRLFLANVSGEYPLRVACVLLMDHIPVRNGIILLLQISKFKMILCRIFSLASCQRRGT